MTARHIKDGFPEGWLVHDRGKGDVSLCRVTALPIEQLECFCKAPALLTADEWLPTAQLIAISVARTYAETRAVKD